MYDDLAEILRRRIEVVQDPDEQLELYFRRGAIFSDALGDLDQALACYTSVLEQESRNRRALEAIEAIHFRREDVAEAVRDLREADRRRRGRRRDGRHLRAHGADLVRRAQQRGQGDRAVAARPRHPRRGAAGAAGARRAVHPPRAVGRARRDPRAPGRGRADRSATRSRCTSSSAGSGRTSSSASATRSTRGSPPIGSTATTSRRCARWRTSTARRRRGTSCPRPSRRIIDVGQLTGAIDENETIELYAQLGQLEGDVLGRVDDAVDAWRRVIAIDPSDFRALAALEGLFTREGRWEEAIDVLEKRALVLDDEAQRRDNAAAGRRDLGGEGRGPHPRRAGLRARPRERPGERRPRRDRLEAIYQQQYKWTELVEILLERVGAAPQRRGADHDPQPGRQDLRGGDRRPGVRVLRAPGRVQARLLARRDRERARAPRHGDQPLAGAARRVHQPRQRARARGPRRGRRPVGQDRPLVRASTCRTSSTRSTRCSRRCASIRATPVRSAAWPSCSASAARGAS